MEERSRGLAIGVGQGELVHRAAVVGDRVACIEAGGASDVHRRVNFDKEDRLAEETDLLSNLPPASIPDGCNEAQAGRFRTGRNGRVMSCQTRSTPIPLFTGTS